MRTDKFKTVVESVSSMTEVQLDQLVAAVEQRRLRIKALGANLSQAPQVGVANAAARKRAEVWLAENREALESSNRFVETHGLPLAQYRNF